MYVSIWPEGFTSSLSSVFPWKVPVLSIRVPYSSSSCLFAFKIFHEFWWKIPTTEWTEGVGVSKRTRKSQAKIRKHQAKNLIQCIFFFSLFNLSLLMGHFCFCKVKKWNSSRQWQRPKTNKEERMRYKKSCGCCECADDSHDDDLKYEVLKWERERPLFSIFFSFLCNQLCEGWRW